MKQINIILDNVVNKKLPSLRDEYVKALKDDHFRSLMGTIDIPEEELMKYTSKLEDSVKELENCTNCNHLLECKNSVEGFVYTPNKNNDKLVFSYVACKYKQNQIKESAYQDNVYVIDIPKEIRTASMKDIYKDDTTRLEVIKWLKEFITNYHKERPTKGLFLNGNFGSGKTYLIAAMFNELAKKGVQSAIIYWPEYLRSLKASFNENFGEKFEYIQKIPLLLIDDIGAENTTSWARDEILGPILQYRMQEELPTFFTSNLSINDLEKHFSTSSGTVDVVKARRIIERINQLTISKEMISKNRRS